MTDRRPIRVDDRFLELLDAQLGDERGPNGEPSTTDFLLVELPPIAERFATAFASLITPIPQRPDYRSVLAVGSIVPRILVTGHENDDGSIVLLSVQLDLDARW